MSETINKKCTGCNIVNKEIIPIGGIIYETENFLLFQDTEVPIKGFLIVQANKHINSIIDFTEEELIELVKLINKAREALKELDICNEVTIVQEERSKHFHVWLFPNYEWMQEKFGKGIKYLRDISQYAKENVTPKDMEEVLEVVEKIKDIIKIKSN